MAESQSAARDCFDIRGSEWTEAVLCNFNSSTGESPHGGLTLKSGALYGHTSKGSRSSGDLGTVFELLPPSSPGARSMAPPTRGGTRTSGPYSCSPSRPLSTSGSSFCRLVPSRNLQYRYSAALDRFQSAFQSFKLT